MARTETETRPTEPDPATRAQVRTVRIVSMVVAVVLVVTAAIVLTRHHPPVRSTASFCDRIQQSRDLSTVLASGQPAQIVAAVHRFDRVVEVAPLGIESQVLVLARYADGLAAAVDGSSDAKGALRQAMTRQQGQVAGVEAAGRAVDQFVAANCHLTLSPAGDTVASLPATGPTGPG